MNVKVEMEWEGRMGNNLTKVYTVLVDGENVGYSKRKWLADAIADAISTGKIEASGDTTMRLVKWAYANDRALFDRIDKLPSGY